MYIRIFDMNPYLLDRVLLLIAVVFTSMWMMRTLLTLGHSKAATNP